MKKKTKSIFAVVLAIILLLLVAVTLFTNVLFSRSDTPKVFGHYIYMMESDTMEAPVATGVTSLQDSSADSGDANAVEVLRTQKMLRHRFISIQLLSQRNTTALILLQRIMRCFAC